MFETELKDLRKYFSEKTVIQQNKNPNFKKDYVLESTKYIIENAEKNQAILGKVKCILSKLNAVTQNGTYYSTNWYYKTIENNKVFQDKLIKKRVLGETDHPENPDGHINNISHTVIKIWLDGNDVWGEIEIFNTPSGNILWTLLKAGVILGISSRGIGDESFESGVKKIKEDNFEMIGWDFVTNASAIGAEFKGFTEDKKREFTESLTRLKDKYNDNYSKAVLESLFSRTKEQNNMIELTEKIAELENEIKEYENKLTLFSSINKKLISEKLDLTNKLNTTITDSEMLKIKLESANKSLFNKDEEFKNLSGKITLVENEIKDKRMVVEKQKKEIDELKVKKENKNIEVYLTNNKKSETKKEENNIYESAMRNRYTIS